MLLNRWPMQFMDTNDDRINVSPENNKRLALPLRDEPEVFTNEVSLKFDFFKQKFKYKFFALNNLFDQLGGASSAAAGFVKKFGSIFLILFMVQFGIKISTMHKEKLKDFIDTNYRPKIPFYKQII